MNDLFYHYHIIPFRSFSSRPSRSSVRPFSWSQDWCGWSRRMEGNQAMRNKAGRRRGGRQPKSVFTSPFYFFFFFTVSLLSLRRLRHDAFSCLLFLFFYTVGGARRILFCFVWLGWVKKKNWFGFGFRCVVIGLGMMGGEGECLLFDCLCLRYLWYIELEWPTPSFCLFALFCNAVLVVSL